MVTKLRPLGDHVVVEQLEQEEATASGILLPETAKDRPQEGKVLAVGPGRALEDGSRGPMEVKEGDRVVFAKFAGTEVNIGERKLLVLKQGDILGVVEKRVGRARRPVRGRQP